MFKKEINLVFEDSGVKVEYNSDSTLVTLRVNDYLLNENKSTPELDYYEERNMTEIYLTSKQLKEVIKALEQMVVEEDEE
ncbi:hypothetical protein [Bacillus sp. 1P02SD]|uniref:hypothetical protein n=1 Tax=Bacillus sp. 1P02SD TaxID=3132264 RepID=UPI0039A30215